MSVGYNIVQSTQHDVSTPGKTVLDAWVNAPTTAKAAVAASKAQSAAKGSNVQASEDVLTLRYQNRDYYRDRNDTASIL
jgi:hypothetical protein